MRLEDFQRAGAVAWRAAGRRGLSYHDFEEVAQEAAIAAWKHGIEPSTKVYWAAFDAADNIQFPRRKHLPTEILSLSVSYTGEGWDEPFFANDDVEGDVVGGMWVDEMLACLSPAERFVVEAIVVGGCTQAELALMLGLNDGTVCKRWHSGLRRLRDMLEAS